MNERHQHLLSPWQVGKLTIKNRFVLAPMGMVGMGHNSYDSKGHMTMEGIHHYTEYARGGFGLLIGGSMPTDIEIDGNDRFNRLTPLFAPKHFKNTGRQMTDRVHSYGAKMFAQISLGVGRSAMNFKSCSPNPRVFAPDDITGELTVEEIKRKVELEVEAARRCQEAGFDGVDIHAMHWGYLLDQFAMSCTNHRTDEYGGSLDNRLRVAREVVEGIHQVCGDDFPVSIRLGLKSYLKKVGGIRDCGSLTGEEEIGRTLEEGVEICKKLESYGYNMLNCDVGVYESFYHGCPPMYVPKCNYVDLAAKAKEAVSIPVLLANRMDDPDLADKAVAEGKVDGVVLGRAALADPAYPKKVAMGTLDAIRPCLACCQCIDVCTRTGDVEGCTVNPSVTRELTYGIVQTVQPKKVAVIGGGCAGMEAAIVARKSGHEVTLYEASGELGGNLIPAGVHRFKKEVRDLNAWMKREVRRVGVEVKMDTKASADMIAQSGADVAILATGSTPVMPPIKGIDHAKSVSCLDVLNGKRTVGDAVTIVGGGLVGCEMAIEYAMEGKKVTLVEALDDIMSSGPAVPMMQDMMVRELLKEYKVTVRTGYRITEVNDKGAVISPMKGKGKDVNVKADTVVMAVGFRSAPSMEQDFYGTGIEVYTIGDANRVGSVKTSIWDAYEVARNL